MKFCLKKNCIKQCKNTVSLNIQAIIVKTRRTQRKRHLLQFKLSPSGGGGGQRIVVFTCNFRVNRTNGCPFTCRFLPSLGKSKSCPFQGNNGSIPIRLTQL